VSEKREHIIALIDAYLAQGYVFHSVGGGAGEDWREIKVVMRKGKESWQQA
jgi:hypothetical protein